MAGPDPELLAGARHLASGAWRASHEAFEEVWRRSQGEPRELMHALAQLAAALLKWSDGHPEPAGTLLGRVRRRLEVLPSRVARVEVDMLESTVQALEEQLARGEPAPSGVHLAFEGRAQAVADRVPLGTLCPYCGERVTVHVEPTGVSTERYVEDCPVCCRPWTVQVERSPSGPGIVLAREDD
jgi:Cysteine-rich CPXCG/Domain of unknown function (DUF309)